MGVGFGYLLFVYDFLLKGMSKLEVNVDIMKVDFDVNWEFLVELI